ncbi:MAG TPA: MXAN_5187 C-terminal domain-containing protein [Thermoanaerobaculia bacterium]|nr:MXAN_5187 C-terminal domain-containing protein [Thermoanaerobaculia bacterium]
MKQDDELERLEEMIRVVKNKYDQFFAGIQKMPPMTERRGVDVFIHELNKQKMRDNAKRFRFNQLTSRYNQYREMWGRKMREREEGPLEFKRRQAALEAPLDEPPRSPSSAGPRVTSGASDAYVRVAAGTNGDAVRQLFEQIEKENSKLGKANNVTFEQLSAMVEKQSEMVRTRYNVNAVAFRVETVDGKVKLKAKPVQGQ